MKHDKALQWNSLNLNAHTMEIWYFYS